MISSGSETLSKSELLMFQERINLELSKRKLELYKPYPKQLEFHQWGKTKRERLFRAGNQLGKTLAGAAEAAYHATGLYPEWWPGRKILKANDGWCSGVTGEVTRDSIQRLLIGPVGREGTGFIPEKMIEEKIMARGVANLVDTLLVKNIHGGKSRIKLKYYEQGREKFQADTIDWAWNDEESPQDIYTEILTRTNATGGFIWTTFTPLLGMSEVVRRFLNEPSPDRADINMTISDVTHISEEEKQRIIASYPAHEREARINGKPMLGSGRIFPVSEESIKVPRFEIPQWYRKIGGLDFGWDHPTAAAKIAYNPDSDIIYLTHVYKRSEAIPALHASALRSWGKDLPWSWPHDGLQHDKGSGENLADQYKREGLNMLPERATFDDGTNGVEAGLMEMLTRMENGTFKVFDSCQLFLDEMLMYHRKDGKVVKEFDDVISACLHPETEVITRKGILKIKDLVNTEGEVLSINGKWERYTNCRMTRVNAKIVRVTYSDGHELICTPDHKLLCHDRKWIPAIDSQGMKCHNALGGSLCKISYTKAKNIQNLGITTAPPSVFSCIGQYGKIIMGKSRQNITSIIKMEIKRIMIFLTWNAYSEQSTYPSIKKDTVDARHGRTREPKNIENLNKEKNIARNLLNSIEGESILKSNLPASSVKKSIREAPTMEDVFVRGSVHLNGEENQVLTILKNHAVFAGKHLLLLNTITQFVVRVVAKLKCGFRPKQVKHTLSVLRVENVSQRSDVYCLEVPNTEAFAIANGAIVHNCRYAIMMLRYSRPDSQKPAFGTKETNGHQVNYDPLSKNAARGK